MLASAIPKPHSLRSGNRKGARNANELLEEKALVSLTATSARSYDPTGGGGYYQLRTSDNHCISPEHESLNKTTQMEEAVCNPTNLARAQALIWNPNDCIYVQHGGGYSTAYCTIRTTNNKCLSTYAGSSSAGAYAVIYARLGTGPPDQYSATS